MIVIINSSKTMQDSPADRPAGPGSTLPRFIEAADFLVGRLRRLPPAQIRALLKTSDKLTALTLRRLSEWQADAHRSRGQPALFSFCGDIYEAIGADHLSRTADLKFAQRHLRILSGLYGILRPLDQIQAYRLEMDTGLVTPAGKNLYAFWGDRIADALQADIGSEGSGVLLNLVSNEYLKAARTRRLKARIVQPVFKEFKNGAYKTIALYAKQARGLLTGFILRNALTAVDDIKRFDLAGYRFRPSMSTDNQWVFARKA